MEATGSPSTNGASKTLPSTKSTAATRWIRSQAVNARRHFDALRPFRNDEFGTGPESPSEAHIKSANELITVLRTRLERRTRRVNAVTAAALRQPTTPRLQLLVRAKESAHGATHATERVWDFYLELFGQRQSVFGTWLLSCDRIAQHCYQAAYTGLGQARSIPTPPPFCYMRTGFSPATFRRGIPLRRLGLKLNPFPLIQIPYHRLVNPWTLGAILHEVSHNLQNDLGLARLIPQRIGQTLLRAGCGRAVAAVWSRWNRETFADLSALLLGGPAVVASLMDIIGRSPETVKTFNPRGPHPTPYLRAFLSIELLRRLGFAEHADQYRRLWMRMYPNPRSGTIPAAILDSFPTVCRLVVDAICFQPYEPLGNKTYAEVIPFGMKEQQMIREAAGRLASGTDPGIIPERYLIGAARMAMDRKLASPEAITQAFYHELTRR